MGKDGDEAILGAIRSLQLLARSPLAREQLVLVAERTREVLRPFAVRGGRRPDHWPQGPEETLPARRQRHVRDDVELAAATRTKGELEEPRRPALEGVERIVHHADLVRIDERRDRLPAKKAHLQTEELHRGRIRVPHDAEAIGDEVGIRRPLEEVRIPFALRLEAESHPPQLVELRTKLLLRDEQLFVLEAQRIERLAKDGRVLLEPGLRPEELGRACLARPHRKRE